ncbi:hypothetical protein Vretimale_19124 [Volvox reticuliferus]|uniref:Uncharacterized protein n=1 Tax=Volvox reticuliferus TaxID=1737510 RepID=A0A8J4LYY5_9CHLO|nr:hypothetical protein Vretimale_19124 [Volvox reticuliferus]
MIPPPTDERAGVPAERPPLAPEPAVPQVYSRLRPRRPLGLPLLPTSASKPPPRELEGDPPMIRGGGTFAAIAAPAIVTAAAATTGCSAELADATDPVVVPILVRAR